MGNIAVGRHLKGAFGERESKREPTATCERARKKLWYVTIPSRATSVMDSLVFRRREVVDPALCELALSVQLGRGTMVWSA
jgi:hypothetical protein